MVQGIILKDGTVLISQIEEVLVDLGEPNCRLIDPYIFDENEEEFSRWMQNYTEQTQFMLLSDSILTLFSPKIKYVDYYNKINGIVDKVENEEETDVEEEHY